MWFALATREQGYLFWSALWILLLVLPPGSKAIATAYRLNFMHGLLSTIVALTCMSGLLPEAMTTTATITYFIIDFINIIINDFIFKVPSYQKPTARKVEYFHHCFCAFVAIMCEYRYRDFCGNYTVNPFVRIMFAEVPTPFLIAWRYTDQIWLGGLFTIAFLLVRIIYQGFILVPEFMTECHFSVGYGFGIPYNLMNFYFFYMIVKKIIRGDEGSGKSKEKEKK